MNLPMETMKVREGLVLLDRYELKIRIGEGGTGVVWKALDTRLDAPAAIKFLKCADSVSEQRFSDEGRIAAGLSTPHVVRAIDRGLYEGTPFLVMEYLEGQTLRERLLIRGSLPPGQVVSIVEQVARALDAVHEREIVHRDVKPANIFLVGSDHPPFVKIFDFGSSKIEAGEWTKTGSWLGTPHYVSPEQAHDASMVDQRADVWALAVVAYECLTGKRPFDGTSATAVVGAILRGHASPPTRVKPELPAEIDLVFRAAFAEDLVARPGTASGFAQALEQALNVSPLSPGPLPSEPTLSLRPPGSRRALRLSLGIGVLALVCLAYLAGRSDLFQSERAGPSSLSPPVATLVSEPTSRPKQEVNGRDRESLPESPPTTKEPAEGSAIRPSDREVPTMTTATRATRRPHGSSGGTGQRGPDDEEQIWDMRR